MMIPIIRDLLRLRDVICKPNVEMYKRSLSYLGALDLNSINAEFRNIDNFDVFLI